MRRLAERLRKVRVCCGDWSRLCGPSVTVKHGITGVFLDPPYADEAERTDDLYASDSGSVAHAVRAWALSGESDRECADSALWVRRRARYAGRLGVRRMEGARRVWIAGRTGLGDRTRAASGSGSAPHCLKPQERLLFSELMGTAMRDADEAAERYLRDGTE